MAPPVMQFFTFAHLRDEKMQAVSRPFCELAQRVLELLPDNPERDKALDRLLEAKDAAVRAHIFKEPHQTLPATHRCKVCGALWWHGQVAGFFDARWSLRSPTCGPCCDNVAMGEQIEELPKFEPHAGSPGIPDPKPTVPA